MRVTGGLAISLPKLGGGPKTDPDAILWRTAVIGAGGTVSDARLALVSTYIAALKTAGVWTLLDVVLLFAAENTQSALMCLKRRVSATIGGGTPTFTADSQYAFDGVDDYISTGYTPSTHAVAMTGSSMMLSVYERTNVGTNAVYAAGCTNNATAQNLRLSPRVATNTAAGNANSANGVSGAMADSRGLTAIQRTADPVFEFFKNGASIGTFAPGSSGTTLPTHVILVGGNNNNGTPGSFRACSVAGCHLGASLTSGQHLSLFNATEAYLDAIGAGVV